MISSSFIHRRQNSEGALEIEAAASSSKSTGTMSTEQLPAAQPEDFAVLEQRHTVGCARLSPGARRPPARSTADIVDIATQVSVPHAVGPATGWDVSLRVFIGHDITCVSLTGVHVVIRYPVVSTTQAGHSTAPKDTGMVFSAACHYPADVLTLRAPLPQRRDEAGPAPRAAGYYTVKGGDTLIGLAAIHRSTVGELATPQRHRQPSRPPGGRHDLGPSSGVMTACDTASRPHPSRALQLQPAPRRRTVKAGDTAGPLRAPTMSADPGPARGQRPEGTSSADRSSLRHPRPPTAAAPSAAKPAPVPGVARLTGETTFTRDQRGPRRRRPPRRQPRRCSRPRPCRRTHGHARCRRRYREPARGRPQARARHCHAGVGLGPYITSPRSTRSVSCRSSRP